MLQGLAGELPQGVFRTVGAAVHEIALTTRDKGKEDDLREIRRLAEISRATSPATCGPAMLVPSASP